MDETEKAFFESKSANVITTQLESLEFPALIRPPVAPDAPATLELVHWGIRKYTYGVLAHSRSILRGLLTLAVTGNQPAVAPLNRHLFEWNMNTTYMLVGFRKRLAEGDLQGAWELYLSMVTANGWIKRHGNKYFSEHLPEHDDIPDTLRIKHLVRAYKQYRLDEFGEEFVENEYGYLSEHAHANGICLQNY